MDYLLKQPKRVNVDVKDLVYCSCIRSILEYSCQGYHSSLPKYLLDDIERNQRRVMRMVFPDLSFSEACQKANLPKRAKDVIYYHKTYLLILLESKVTNQLTCYHQNQLHVDHVKDLRQPTECSKLQHVGLIVIRSPL